MKTRVFLVLCLAVYGTAQEKDVEAEMRESITNTSLPIPDGRIVGGVMTRIEAFPYQVSLSNSKSHFCGGSILKSRVVVTAAHCVAGKHPYMLEIRAGSTQHNQGGIVVPVQKIIIHPNFNPSSMDKDIALLVLSNDLPLGAAAQSIEMATAADVLKANAALIVSGWGATNEGSRSSTVLRYTQVQLINQQACARSYGVSGSISSNMFCAGAVGGGRDSCQGDSGGPLIAYRGDKPKLHGIVSWGYGCARPKYPGVYTKVTQMNGWVERSLKSLGY